MSEQATTPPTKDIWQELRKPFPKEVIGLLPKVSCYACTQATKNAKSALDKHCANHKMSKCNDCGAYITAGHIHLDYVGHAAVTDRLNEVVGPENWYWEPLSTDDTGMPKLDSSGNLWIKLHVNGASRVGYGDGSSSIKELIGDALRNAAMRFGIALDLWSKEELESTLTDPEMRNEKPSTTKTDHGRPAASKAATAPNTGSTPPADPLITQAQAAMIVGLAKRASGLVEKEDVFEFIKEEVGTPLHLIKQSQVEAARAKFTKSGDAVAAS